VIVDHAPAHGLMVQADEITWTSAPVARLEDISVETLLTLDPVELLTYAADCRDEVRAVRETLHQALVLVARQHDALARAARVIEWQRQQLRAPRERP
jgi:hypothetical protein